MILDQSDFYDENALLDRLTTGVKRSGKAVSFLVGSAYSAPQAKDQPGVPGVSGIIDLIRDSLDSDAQRCDLDEHLKHSDNQYQDAFKFLIGRQGPQAPNNIIKQAVWKARAIPTGDHSAPFKLDSNASDETCFSFEKDISGWHLSEATAALGMLVSCYPKYFGHNLLTTNFDPLIEVAIQKANGSYFRTMLHRDGNLSQTAGTGCHVIHLHGHWYGTDTLHTPRQLTQPRPQLKSSLSQILRGQILVVSGYGAWDDIFTSALIQVALEDNSNPEIIWTFREKVPSIHDKLYNIIEPALSRSRINLYSGIDAHSFLPKLVSRWKAAELPSQSPPPVIQVHQTPPQPLAQPKLRPGVSAERVRGSTEERDRPPLADHCVGRDAELASLHQSDANIIFISGLGGQGKSTLAAKFYSEKQSTSPNRTFFWRDCKEETDRLESQVIAILEIISSGQVLGSNLSGERMASLAELLIAYTVNKPISVVFDNIDKYVDLENGTLTGNALSLVEVLTKRKTNISVIFTCRPSIKHSGSDIFLLRLEGLDLDATVELFARRGAKANLDSIEKAHFTTRGHAFWLDLLAAQIASKGDTVSIESLLKSDSKNTAIMPTETLHSVWATLLERERIVLRALAETVRPATESEVADYVGRNQNFSKTVKGLRALRLQNLIVIKPQDGSADYVELHPLLREFIRNTFPAADRKKYINPIIAVYNIFFRKFKSSVSTGATFSTLRRWTEGAELCVASGNFDDALSRLDEVGFAFLRSRYPGEFARAAGIVFEQVPFQNHGKFKSFDRVISIYGEVLAQLGRRDEFKSLMDRYKATIPEKTARYINYCAIMCHAAWIQEEFQTAIIWGEEGERLRQDSQVDTTFSAEHNLALSRRDSGKPDLALKTFLKGSDLNAVIDPDELDQEKGEHFYGNIGRCLHLMGQIETALVCYRKSAILLEKSGEDRAMNRGYIRQWIGELLLAKGEKCNASYFLQAAAREWKAVSPARLAHVNDVILKYAPDFAGCTTLHEDEAERFCLAWIYGRETEFAPLMR